MAPTYTVSRPGTGDIHFHVSHLTRIPVAVAYHKPNTTSEKTI
jgi:hypothetical protein